MNEWDSYISEIAKAQNLTIEQAKTWLILALSEPNGWGQMYRLKLPDSLVDSLQTKSSMSLDMFADTLGDWVRRHTALDGMARYARSWETMKFYPGTCPKCNTALYPGIAHYHDGAFYHLIEGKKESVKDDPKELGTYWAKQFGDACRKIIRSVLGTR